MSDEEVKVLGLKLPRALSFRKAPVEEPEPAPPPPPPPPEPPQLLGVQMPSFKLPWAPPEEDAKVFGIFKIEKKGDAIPVVDVTPSSKIEVDEPAPTKSKKVTVYKGLTAAIAVALLAMAIYFYYWTMEQAEAAVAPPAVISPRAGKLCIGKLCFGKSK